LNSKNTGMKFCDGEFEFTSTKMCQYLVFYGEPYPVYSGDCRMKKWGDSVADTG